MLNRISEIGSEFWIKEYPKTPLIERDGVYVLSGRTAIDLVVQNIQKYKAIEHVYMPAWCCDSMLAPFVKRNFKIEFYDIAFDSRIEYKIDASSHTDIFYLTNYFGYESMVPMDLIHKLKENGCIILYDRTHSFLMDDIKYRQIADYSFASIRKWMGIVSGAIVDGIDELILKDFPYVIDKAEAMYNKYRYMCGDDSISKDEFRGAFEKFGHYLAADYSDYKMDSLSYTLYKQEKLQYIIQRRKENAAYIHENLKVVSFVYSFTKNAVPLFVPVIFKTKEQRNFIRQKLIENQIYCPIHWPKPYLIPENYIANELYQRGLSLICDQRYGLEQMKRQIKIIQQNI